MLPCDRLSDRSSRRCCQSEHLRQFIELLALYLKIITSAYILNVIP